MLNPQEGRISPAVEEFVNDILTEVGGEDKSEIDCWVDMLERSPYISPCIEAIALLAVGMIGEYTHDDEEVQGFIRKNFEQMNGSLRWSVSELVSAIAIGYAVSEWSVRPDGDSWMLDQIGILDPRHFTFEGTTKKVENIKYYGEGVPLKIPYERVIHVINQRHISFGRLKGVAACKRAWKMWEAWKIILSCLLVASKRQGTPLLVGYAPSDRTTQVLDSRGYPLLDSFGNPVNIPAPVSLLQQLQQTENNSVVATDINNRIEAIAQSEGRSFLFDALKLLGQLQMLAFLVPDSIFTATGVGDSNLNKGHQSILLSSVRNLLNDILEGILERPIRNLIKWNFGDRDNYGTFQPPQEEEGNAIALLGAITGAVSSGFFSSADLAVINRARSLAGIPAVESIEEIPKPIDYSNDEGEQPSQDEEEGEGVERSYKFRISSEGVVYQPLVDEKFEGEGVAVESEEAIGEVAGIMAARLGEVTIEQLFVDESDVFTGVAIG